MVSYEEAKVLVQEGMAGIVHERLIHKFFDKQTFKKRILERDSYVCIYCGEYGETVDHIVPRIKGGVSSFSNCVCACNRCNANKGDLTLNDFLICFKPCWTYEQITSKRVKQQLHYIQELLRSLTDSLVSDVFQDLNDNEQFSRKVYQIDQKLKELKDYIIIDGDECNKS